MNTLQTNLRVTEFTTSHDYLTGYRRRMEDNNNLFLDMADQLKDKGFNVWINKDGLISYLYIEGNGKHIYFGFTDVPYRFYLQHDIDHRLGNGSGKTLKEEYGNENTFTADYIISMMQPNVKTIMATTQYKIKLS